MYMFHVCVCLYNVCVCVCVCKCVCVFSCVGVCGGEASRCVSVAIAFVKHLVLPSM